MGQFTLSCEPSSEGKVCMEIHFIMSSSDTYKHHLANGVGPSLGFLRNSTL